MNANAATRRPPRAPAALASRSGSRSSQSRMKSSTRLSSFGSAVGSSRAAAVTALIDIFRLHAPHGDATESRRHRRLRHASRVERDQGASLGAPTSRGRSPTALLPLSERKSTWPLSHPPRAGARGLVPNVDADALTSRRDVHRDDIKAAPCASSSCSAQRPRRRRRHRRAQRPTRHPCPLRSRLHASAEPRRARRPASRRGP